MAGFATDAIVLRHAQYKDNDRMVTLFSPREGRIEALARGAKKPGGTMSIASELFSTGRYQLFGKGERVTITGFSLQEGFYPLRLDLDRLGYGAYCLGLCEAAVQPGAGDPALFLLLQQTLAHLAYGQGRAKGVCCCFMLGFAACVGYAPVLSVCAVCGGTCQEPVYALEAGGVCCRACAPYGTRVREETLAWLRTIQEEGLAAMDRAPEPERIAEAFVWLRSHIEMRMEQTVKASKCLQWQEMAGEGR